MINDGLMMEPVPPGATLEEEVRVYARRAISRRGYFAQLYPLFASPQAMLIYLEFEKLFLKDKHT